MIKLLNDYRIPLSYSFMLIALSVLVITGCQKNNPEVDTEVDTEAERQAAAASVPNPDSSEPKPDNETKTQQNDNSPSAPITIKFSDKTIARYLVQEQLLRLNFPNDAIGTTKSVEGNIKINSNGQIDKSNSLMQVNLDDLKSDSSYRDRYVKNKTLETNIYKYAKFIPSEAIGANWPLPISETIEFKLIGDMTIKTTTKRLTWIIKCSNNGSNLIGKATTEFTFGDFNITKPSAMSVVSVEDEIRLEIDFEATIDQ